MALCVWLLSLSIMSPRLIHVIMYKSYIFKNKGHSSLRAHNGLEAAGQSAQDFSLQQPL